MQIRCAQCGRPIHRNHIQDGDFYFCDEVCYFLHLGQALEYEPADLEDEWNAEQQDAE